MAVVSWHTYKQVRVNFGPWWRLDVNNWGNLGAAADATSLAAPVAADVPDGGAAAVMIGPLSTVDEAIILYTDPVPNPANTLGTVQRELTFGVNKPFIDVPGPYSFKAALTSQFSDTYFKDGTAAAQPFGSTNLDFEAPYLQTISYLTAPSVLPHRQRRDMFRESVRVAIAGTEVTLGIWPVMGRKRISIWMNASNTLVANTRIGLISAGTAGTPAIERTFATGTINAGTGANYEAAITTAQSFVAAYFTQTAGAGNCSCFMLATDE
jgi:hypothetical protein